LTSSGATDPDPTCTSSLGGAGDSRRLRPPSKLAVNGLTNAVGFLTQISRENASMQDAQIKAYPTALTGERPSKHWRNWWWAPKRGISRESGKVIEIGPYCHETVYPTREVAEQRAIEWMARFPMGAFAGNRYLGAFADDDRPL
jgi:hypothetical protein